MRTISQACSELTPTAVVNIIIASVSCGIFIGGIIFLQGVVKENTKATKENTEHWIAVQAGVVENSHGVNLLNYRTDNLEYSMDDLRDRTVNLEQQHIQRPNLIPPRLTEAGEDE